MMVGGWGWGFPSCFPPQDCRMPGNKDRAQLPLTFNTHQKLVGSLVSGQTAALSRPLLQRHLLSSRSPTPAPLGPCRLGSAAGWLWPAPPRRASEGPVVTSS